METVRTLYVGFIGLEHDAICGKKESTGDFISVWMKLSLKKNNLDAVQ